MLGLGTEAVASWCQRLRICVANGEAAQEKMLGGKGMVVECDECEIGRGQKGLFGHKTVVKGDVWGAICRSTGRPRRRPSPSSVRHSCADRPTDRQLTAHIAGSAPVGGGVMGARFQRWVEGALIYNNLDEMFVVHFLRKPVISRSSAEVYFSQDPSWLRDESYIYMA